jgi:hypothetical protein
MSKADDDFNALPSQADVYKAEGSGNLVRLKPEGCDGMTLRDWFAGQALYGIAMNFEKIYFKTGGESMASLAYELADFMLAERDKP